MQGNIYTVSQVNNYIKRLLEKDVFLREVFMQGEISNFKAHSSGHLYLTLKDENASINAVMYRGSAEKLRFTPQNGMKVTVFGYISLYEKTGQYQIYLQIMEPAGKGALYLAFEQLKARLEKVGLFDEKHKKAIPQMPKCVAVVTSPTGAAVRDIIQIAKRRNPNVKIVVVPVLVQGENAAADIVKGIELVNQWGKADTIIVGRGGGSIEDLWAFNEEIVAKAIFQSNIPVISAVGHETDFTIADFIADMRAPTPSAAAELAVPEVKGISDRLLQYNARMSNAVNKKFVEHKNTFERLQNSYSFKNYLDNIYDSQIYSFELYKKLVKEINQKLQQNRLVLQLKINDLENKSPMNILKKGYSLTYNEGGNIIKSVGDININDTIKVKLCDGELSARVIDKGGNNG